LVPSEFPDVAIYWGLRVLYAALILGAGIWIGSFVSKFIRRQAESHPRIDTTLANFLSRIVRYAIFIIVLITVLQMFGVQTTSLVAVLGASALAIGLALQGTLGNVASGIMIVLMRPYHIGDFVELNGKEGIVTDLDLFFTELRTPDDRRVLIPNGQAVSNPIVNHTTHGLRRCVITVGIGYDDDIDKAFDVMRGIVMAHPKTVASPAPWFGVESLGDFAINVTLRASVKTPDHKNYRAELIKAVKEAFDREGIDMPYPHAVEISKGELVLRQPPIKPPPEFAQS
jgi:small conductance mechanosensitive channel